MRKLITEFIGTFFLVLTVGMVVTEGKGDFSPIAIGAVLLCMVFAGAHISGAHYNPAVTLAVLLRGTISISEGISYMIVQIVAAIAASYMVLFLAADKIPAEASGMQNITGGLMAEMLGTFALAYVVLNVATARGTLGNMFYGLAIGFTVLSMTYALGPVSGGAFNPAVAVGMMYTRLASWSNLWIYLIGCFGGAILAAIVFRINNSEDH